jgi:NarL family two-component system response regulator LiaR
VSFIYRYKQIIAYGFVLAVIILLLKWLELSYLMADEQFETTTGLIAVVFTTLGVWLTMKLRKPKIKTVIVEKKVFLDIPANFILNEQEARRLNLSKRELEVLQLMAEGLSNQEIASRLFLSPNTVKTHAAQLFEKMEVKRRTQAIATGKKLCLIP